MESCKCFEKYQIYFMKSFVFVTWAAVWYMKKEMPQKVVVSPNSDVPPYGIKRVTYQLAV